MASSGSGTTLRHLLDIFETGSLVGLDDADLLARYARSQDPSAFEALVQRHGPMVLATCRAVLRLDHDVEDAFQATFLVLARKAHSIRNPHTLGGWLHRVAYRASLQARKTATRRRQTESEASLMPPPNDPSRLDPDTLALLHNEINRLPDRHRLPIILCDLEGLTYDQAATRLHWTLPTLRTRLAKARQTLKSRLLRRGFPVVALGILSAPPSASSALASAAVPASLVRSAVSAATTGTASTGSLHPRANPLERHAHDQTLPHHHRRPVFANPHLRHRPHPRRHPALTTPNQTPVRHRIHKSRSETTLRQNTRRHRRNPRHRSQPRRPPRPRRPDPRKSSTSDSARPPTPPATPTAASPSACRARK